MDVKDLRLDIECTQLSPLTRCEVCGIDICAEMGRHIPKLFRMWSRYAPELGTRTVWLPLPTLSLLVLLCLLLQLIQFLLPMLSWLVLWWLLLILLLVLEGSITSLIVTFAFIETVCLTLDLQCSLQGDKNELWTSMLFTKDTYAVWSSTMIFTGNKDEQLPFCAAWWSVVAQNRPRSANKQHQPPADASSYFL